MYRQLEKNLLSSNISSICPHNMVNFGPLAAEIFSLVWGTPGNFNGFRVLAALLHGTLVVGVSQTAALNRGRHLYSAGRPSRWALAHILVTSTFCCDNLWRSIIIFCGSANLGICSSYLWPPWLGMLEGLMPTHGTLATHVILMTLSPH